MKINITIGDKSFDIASIEELMEKLMTTPFIDCTNDSYNSTSVTHKKNKTITWKSYTDHTDLNLFTKITCDEINNVEGEIEFPYICNYADAEMLAQVRDGKYRLSYPYEHIEKEILESQSKCAWELIPHNVRDEDFSFEYAAIYNQFVPMFNGYSNYYKNWKVPYLTHFILIQTRSSPLYTPLYFLFAGKNHIEFDLLKEILKKEMGIKTSTK